MLIASLLSAAVQGVPNISATLKTTITDIVGSIKAIFASGTTVSLDPTTILLALAGVITTLRADPNLPSTTLAIIGGLDDAIAAALAADKQAQVSVDPNLLTPIQDLP